MSVPSLQRTALLSAALHLSALVLMILVVRQPHRIFIPSPYTVDLVSVPMTRNTGKSIQSAAKSAPVESSSPAVTEKSRATEEKTTVTEETRISDRIAELKAKKKIEKIVRLRSLVSVKGEGKSSPPGSPAQQNSSASSEGSLFDAYYARLTNEIRSQWVFPDTGKSDLEAVIAVAIASDGTISVQGIEKSSGNQLFDRSAMRALAKASPVSPPPFEMEIGIRFYP